MLTIDFETFYSKDYSLRKYTTEHYIRSAQFEVIGVAVKKDNQPTIFHAADPSDWKGSIQKALDQYDFANEIVIAHNAAFDMAILNWHFGHRPKFIVDTLSMARPLTSMTVGGSLKALAEYFNIGHKGTTVHDMLNRHRSDMSDEDIKAYGEYCKLDVDLTYQLFWKLKPHSTTQEMLVIDLLIRMFSEPMLVLDKPLLENHLKSVKAKQATLLADAGLESRDDLMSNPKFAELLKSLGVEPPMKVSARTGKETYAFAKNDLEFTALLENEDPRVQALVAARLGLKSTIEETRTNAFLGIAERGELPIMLNYHGGHTGRASGGENNPQNLPRGGALRKAIRAPKGYALVVSDSSQIEARTLAWFAGQTDLVEEFKHGVDVYSSFATTVYGYKVTKAEHPVERHVGKTCILGLGYGTGHVKLRHALATSKPKVDLSLEEAQRIVKLYRRRYSRIPQLWQDADYALNALVQGYTTTLGVGVQLKVERNRIILPNGMNLHYNALQTRQNPFSGKPELVYYDKKFPKSIYGAKVIENVVQALARIVVFDQMVAISQWLRTKSAKDGVQRSVVLTVHDEVVACVPDEEKEETYKFMEAAMKVPPAWAQGLPISCDGDWAYCYGDAK